MGCGGVWPIIGTHAEGYKAVAGASKASVNWLGQTASAGLQGDPGKAGPLQRLFTVAKVFSAGVARATASFNCVESTATWRVPVPNLAEKLPKGSSANTVSNKSRRVNIDMRFTCHGRTGVSRGQGSDQAPMAITSCHMAVNVRPLAQFCRDWDDFGRFLRNPVINWGWTTVCPLTFAA